MPRWKISGLCKHKTKFSVSVWTRYLAVLSRTECKQAYLLLECLVCVCVCGHTSSPSMRVLWISALTVFPSAQLPCLWTQPNSSVSMGNVQLPSPVAIERWGSSFISVWQEQRGQIGEGTAGGEKRGDCWVLRGCGGPKSPLKVYLSKWSPTVESDTGLLVLMYRLSSQIPQTLSRIHTLKEVQQQCRGEKGGGKKRGGDVWSRIWSTVALFFQRVVTAED